ncbi:hypothetical protein SAMN05216480_103167 [Pustulibacterium marinum]|uniref:Uncharacterized protein n=1 Tax=Pustulibacterium marinum TaxID=1224947 RepID=A0A1I7G4H6_9FLAO|nr:hypothetical protein [Pustulibacterium marinum]SFU43370.1 hypothetical protein SAMN05216480_103167 [Pustulibacterium marinum]
MFKKLWIVALFTVSATFANQPIEQPTPKQGDVFVINAPEHYGNYQHIDLPSSRTLIKRAPQTDFKRLYGVKVLVTEVTQENGETIVTLQRQDGKKFFNLYKTITANATEALANGELSIAK